MTSMTTTTLFAFGSADKAVVHVFERRNDGDIEHKQTLERSNVTSCNITCVAFSPDGKHLAIGDSNREVILWSSADIRGDDGDDDDEEEEKEEEKKKEEQTRGRAKSSSSPFLAGRRGGGERREGGRKRVWPPKSGVFLKDFKESEW